MVLDLRLKRFSGVERQPIFLCVCEADGQTYGRVKKFQKNFVDLMHCYYLRIVKSMST